VVLTPLCFFFFGVGVGFLFIITSLISFRRDMSEVIINVVPKEKTHNGVRTSAVQEIWLQNYLSGESFSSVPVKYEHSIYINPTPY
jgi:Na+-transporting methylmalonyl-CoA/oxaloacetate decarboxylase gamma subunit